MLNLLNFNTDSLKSLSRRIQYLLIAAIFSMAGLMPIVLQRAASAATLSSRSVSISTSQPDATGVSYLFSFTTQSSTAIQSLVFQFCDTPLGTCVLPGGATAPDKIDVSQVTASAGAFTGTSATAFADYTGADAGGCTEADGGSGVATMFCATRTEPTSETAGAKTFNITGISNPTIPSGNNEEVYVRITTYSDTAFATAVDDGTVAAAIVNQLTVTGRVQERLVFCVFALDDAAASNGTVGTAATNFPTNCSAAEATASSNVDIGVVDNLSVARSPVANSPPSSLGNARLGAAMVNTNASNGVSLSYYATGATSGTNQLRSFRVPGASCDAATTTLTDQCFRSALDNANAGTLITAGGENFGMQIVCVTNSNTTTAGTTANLGTGGNGTGSGNTFRTAYANGDTTLVQLQDTPATDDCENTEAGNTFAWNDTSTAQAIIGSTTVVDDELVKLRFGATAEATTPTGSYTVASTFIATATF